ncbi:hypothetical protein TKK_0009840 [Trichogramma kaykai]|uniref:Uncharacterized protein n=1 Tax=Trichogramma kaykai TaxID=54128 RepID=A0ABD2X2C1_9HYME
MAKDCHSTVNHPLFVREGDDKDDNMYVIQKCILPELHLLQGFVNYLFWNGLVPEIGREKALLWPHKLSLVPKTYQDVNLVALRKVIVSTGVSQTLKIHVLLDHLKDGLAFLKNDGLGLWSEQAGESVHREFLKYWERFKINAIDDKAFSSRLNRAVVTFSSQHMCRLGL